MPPTLNEFIMGGVDLCAYGVPDDDGILKGGTEVAPAAGNVTGSAMSRVRGVTSITPNFPARSIVDVPGDNRSQGSFDFEGDGSPSFNVTKSVYNQILATIQRGLKVYQNSFESLSVVDPITDNPRNMCFRLQSPIKSKDAGYEGAKGWHGFILSRCDSSSSGRQEMATKAVGLEQMIITPQPVSFDYRGVEITDDDFGTEGGRVIHFASPYPILDQRFTGNNIVTVFTLKATPYSATSVIVMVNGVLVDPGDYTVNPTTRALTFDTAPASGAKIVVSIGLLRWS